MHLTTLKVVLLTVFFSLSVNRFISLLIFFLVWSLACNPVSITSLEFPNEVFCYHVLLRVYFSKSWYNFLSLTCLYEVKICFRFHQSSFYIFQYTFNNWSILPIRLCNMIEYIRSLNIVGGWSKYYFDFKTCKIWYFG